MAHSKLENKREVILNAATRIVASNGLGAPTATIAKEARVANGSLFNYFPTKADLLNQLYLQLKCEALAAALTDLPARATIEKQMLHAWRGWVHWAAANPAKRRPLAQLSVSSEVAAETLVIAHEASAGLAKLLERCWKSGPLRKQPFSFVAAIVEAFAGATMDSMINDPDNADSFCASGFEALWRAIA